MDALRVILVDDEADFREPVSRYLRKSGMDVRGVDSVEALDILLAEFPAQVVILDVNLPGESGLDAVHRLRQQTSAGLVMVTARGNVNDRVQGLSQGADSYFGKPVDLRELEAAIRSLAGRIETLNPDVWIFDRDRWLLRSPLGEDVELTSDEYKLLVGLTDVPGETVDRDSLLRRMNKAPRNSEDRRLDVLVSRLRAKFSQRKGALPVKSVRGIGYVFFKPVRCIGDGAEVLQQRAP
jgi:DNA-binding response OmpR family regulator